MKSPHPILPHRLAAAAADGRWRWRRLRRRPGREGRPQQADVVEADKPGTVDLQKQVSVFNGNV
jgi:hypothetical protein